MSHFKKYLREYAERELRLIGFMETEFGGTCLKFLDDLADVAGEDPESMKTVAGMLTRLIDRQPLSAITEEDFETETHWEGNQYIEVQRCTRYPYIYKRNGKYFNDRAIAYVLTGQQHTQYMYQTDRSSKQEIVLPYIQEQKIQYL